MRGLRLGAGVFMTLAVVTAAMAVAGGWESWATLRDQASEFAWAPRPGLLAAALALAVAALLVTGRLWADLFREAGGRAGRREAIAAWLGSNLGRYLPGKIWQLTGIAAYFRARGDSGAAGFATSLALQVVILTTGAGVGVALGGAVALGGLPPVVAGVLGAALLLALHPSVLGSIVRLAARLLRESPPESRLGIRSLARAGAMGVGVWALYGVGFWGIVNGLAPGWQIDPLTATGIFASGYVAGYVVLIAPGGLVVREGAIAALLVALIGLPPGAAAAIAAAARGWTTIAELVAFATAATGLRSRGEAR